MRLRASLAAALAAMVLALAIALSATEARADDAAAEQPRRAMPDYDGRGAPPTTAGDVLLWIPRIVAAPFYLVSEYLIRLPLRGLVTFAENGALNEIADLFTFDKDHKVGLVPTAFIDFGFKPSVGLYFFWDDFLAKDNDLRAQVGTWGPDWINVSAVDRLRLDANTTASLHAGWSRRQDWLFYGVGPRTLEADRSRYGAEVFDAGPAFDFRLGRPFRLHTGVGLRDVRFRDESCCGDPSIGDRIRQGRYPAPPGLEGYDAWYARAEASFDSRRPRPAPQNGVRLAAEVEPAWNFASGSTGTSYVRYGGTAAGFVDVTGKNRTLSLAVTTLFVDPVHGSEIPFREQITLGGSGLMRGYLAGRLVDRSAFVATLQYAWPIWVWLDGTMQVSTGNVFDAGLKDFDPKLFRLSSGIGLRTNSSPDSQFEVLVGFGSETFDQGAKISSFRFAIGSTRGF